MKNTKTPAFFSLKSYCGFQSIKMMNEILKASQIYSYNTRSQTTHINKQKPQKENKLGNLWGIAIEFEKFFAETKKKLAELEKSHVLY